VPFATKADGLIRKLPLPFEPKLYAGFARTTITTTIFTCGSPARGIARSAFLKTNPRPAPAAMTYSPSVRANTTFSTKFELSVAIDRWTRTDEIPLAVNVVNPSDGRPELTFFDPFGRINGARPTIRMIPSIRRGHFRSMGRIL
jgi:hypothetical protein